MSIAILEDDNGLHHIQGRTKDGCVCAREIGTLVDSLRCLSYIVDKTLEAAVISSGQVKRQGADTSEDPEPMNRRMVIGEEEI
jgi:hypothetical protein